MDFQLTPNYDSVSNKWAVGVKGEIDIYNSTSVKDILSNLVQEHPCDIVLDCTELEYIDSTGLGALVAIVKKVKNYQGNVHILNLKPSVAKIFHITNLDKVFLLDWGWSYE